jgi:flagellar basal body-associated protein FliL
MYPRKGYERKRREKMTSILTSILLILFALILVALFVIGFLYYYNAHESEPLTPEQAKEIRENYEKQNESNYSNNFLDDDDSDGVHVGAGIFANPCGIQDDFWN